MLLTDSQLASFSRIISNISTFFVNTAHSHEVKAKKTAPESVSKRDICGYFGLCSRYVRRPTQVIREGGVIACVAVQDGIAV